MFSILALKIGSEGDKILRKKFYTKKNQISIDRDRVEKNVSLRGVSNASFITNTIAIS